MIYILIYLVLVLAHAITRYLVDDKTDIESVAFNYWLRSLAKNGYPKKVNGTKSTYVELYAYWCEYVDKKPWCEHAKRQFDLLKTVDYEKG